MSVLHNLLPFFIFWLAGWYNRFLGTLFYYTLWPKMLFSKTLDNTWSLSFWHIIALVFSGLISHSIANFKWFVIDLLKGSVLTLIHLYFGEVYIWPHFFTLLNSLNLFIFSNFCILWPYSINTLLNIFFVRINVDNVLFGMVNSKLSHVSQHLIIIQKYLDFSLSFNYWYNIHLFS